MSCPRKLTELLSPHTWIRHWFRITTAEYIPPENQPRQTDDIALALLPTACVQTISLYFCLSVCLSVRCIWLLYKTSERGGAGSGTLWVTLLYTYINTVITELYIAVNVNKAATVLQVSRGHNDHEAHCVYRLVARGRLSLSTNGAKYAVDNLRGIFIKGLIWSFNIRNIVNFVQGRNDGGVYWYLYPQNQPK